MAKGKEQRPIDDLPGSVKEQVKRVVQNVKEETGKTLTRQEQGELARRIERQNNPLDSVLEGPADGKPTNQRPWNIGPRGGTRGGKQQER